MRSALRVFQRLEMKKKANLRNLNGSKETRSKQQEENPASAGTVTDDCFHRFTEDELLSVQRQLLEWYDDNKRDLPWRQQSKVSDLNRRAYGVWVSEIMLQQTQVATVIDYYKRWMEKWPTLQDLAEAKLEEVNEMWSGLGYYSRGRRLHEGAQKVVRELEGEMPRTSTDLQTQLPGVGRYTAGAVASIAFGQKSGVVDGNVIRVLSRLRMIGADSAAQTTMAAFWDVANSLAACSERPGDLNQGLMELGATVCTPKTPQCAACPLQYTCHASAKVEREKKISADRLMSKEHSVVPDIECLTENCGLCLPTDDPWNNSLGVQNFPRKAKKKAPREQSSSVCVVCKVGQGAQQSYLVLQRPEKGLLAGLWEFPSTDEETDTKDPSSSPVVLQQLRDVLGLTISQAEQQAYLGQVVHIFSHIHQTYLVSMVTVKEENIIMATKKAARWLTREELETAALSTAMRKVFKLYTDGNGHSKGSKRKAETPGKDGKKQRSIDSFFTTPKI